MVRSRRTEIPAEEKTRLVLACWPVRRPAPRPNSVANRGWVDSAFSSSEGILVVLGAAVVTS